MKITKVFSIVLSLHVGVILLVMFQPSCQTAGVRQGSEKPESNSSISPDQSFNQALPVRIIQHLYESQVVFRQMNLQLPADLHQVSLLFLREPRPLLNQLLP